MNHVTITLIGRDNCHLCDDAKPLVEAAVSSFSNVELVTAVVEDNPQWMADFSHKVPVVLIEGHAHSQWRVKVPELTQALLAAGGIFTQEKSE